MNSELVFKAMSRDRFRLSDSGRILVRLEPTLAVSGVLQELNWLQWHSPMKQSLVGNNKVLLLHLPSTPIQSIWSALTRVPHTMWSTTRVSQTRLHQAILVQWLEAMVAMVQSTRIPRKHIHLPTTSVM